MPKNFFILDVFTGLPFKGNQLAVFPDAEGLPALEMQQIAAEIGFSETVFVLPSEATALRRLRIFTPRQELPLAGHPVIGAWTLLASLGVTPQVENGTVEILHELEAGILPVEIRFSDGRPDLVTMTQAPLELGPSVTDREQIRRIADALGLERDAVADSESLPIRTSSTGIVSLDVPVRSLEDLGRISVNPQLLVPCYRELGAIGCHTFSLESIEQSSRLHARFFAPDDNISEDAATGSASGSLAGYLVNHGTVEPGEFVIEQGDFMGRPSRIRCHVEKVGGTVGRIRVGGEAVVVAKGEFLV